MLQGSTAQMLMVLACTIYIVDPCIDNDIWGWLEGQGEQFCTHRGLLGPSERYGYFWLHIWAGHGSEPVLRRCPETPIKVCPPPPLKINNWFLEHQLEICHNSICLKWHTKLYDDNNSKKVWLIHTAHKYECCKTSKFSLQIRSKPTFFRILGKGNQVLTWTKVLCCSACCSMLFFIFTISPSFSRHASWWCGTGNSKKSYC